MNICQQKYVDVRRSAAHEFSELQRYTEVSPSRSTLEYVAYMYIIAPSPTMVTVMKKGSV